MDDLEKAAEDYSCTEYGMEVERIAFKAGYNHLMPELDKMANELFVQEGRIKELEEKLAISSQIMDAMTKTSQNNYKLTQQVKDIEQQLYQSNKERAESEQKLAIAVEALELISLDNIYVGENGWRDEHFLNVKQAKEALAKINQK
jgi:septal ring factor EnvC (AmiA/AmiB activator)